MCRLKCSQQFAQLLKVITGLLLVVFIVACDREESQPDNLENNNNISTALPKPFARLTNLKLDSSNFEIRAIINNQIYKVTNISVNDANNTFSGKIENVPKGDQKIQLQYYVQGVPVAESDFFNVSVQGGTTSNATVNPDAITYMDDDGDGYSNLTELDANTDIGDISKIPLVGKPNVIPPKVKNAETIALNETVKLKWEYEGLADSFHVYLSEIELDTENFNSTGLTKFENITNSFVVPTSLVNDTQYHFYIAAENAEGESITHAVGIPTMPDLPVTPTNPVTSTDNRTIAWDDVVNAREYEVRFVEVPSDGTFSELLDVFHSQTVQTSELILPAALLNNTEYFYNVVAKNASGESSPSVVGQVTMTFGQPADIVFQNVVIQPGNSDISWQKRENVKYAIYLSESNEMTLENYKSFGQAQKFDDISPPFSFPENLSSGINYNAVLEAYTTSGSSTTNSLINFLPLPLAPVVTGEAQNKNINLTWNEVPGASQYVVYMANDAAIAANNFRELQGGMRHFTEKANFTHPSALANDTNYYFVVSAVNGSGEGPVSAFEEVTPFLPLPSVPQHFHIEPTPRNILLTWNSDPFAESFKIYMAADAGVTPENYKTLNAGMFHPVNGTDTFFVHPSPLNSTTEYCFVVIASNASGDSNRSETQCTIPKEPIRVTENYVGKTLENAIISFQSGQDKDKYSIKIAETVDSVDVPPVKVKAQDPAVDEILAGNILNITSGIPPNSKKFLTLPHLPAPEAGLADAYYAAIDPTNSRTNLNDWLKENKFLVLDGQQAYEESDAEVLFYNRLDHDLARRVFLKRGTNGQMSFYADHYVNLGDGITESNVKETVAIEFSPAPDGSGENYVKFYAFGPDGNRVGQAELDDVSGPRQIPNLCMTCHGGKATTLNDGVFPNNGNVNSRLAPFDLDAFDFDEENPLTSKDMQEDWFRMMNQAVLDSLVGASGQGYMEQKESGAAVAFAADNCSEAQPSTQEIPLSFANFNGTIADVNVTVDSFTTPDVSQVTLSLLSPNGSEVLLVDQKGSGANLQRLIFDTEATQVISDDNFTGPVTGSFKPEAEFSSLLNSDPNGEWRLKVVDTDVCGEAGNFAKWSLQIRSAQPAAEELISAWYGNTSPLAGNFDGSAVPAGWTNKTTTINTTSDELYSKVIAKSCRVCHLQRSGNLTGKGLASFDEFQQMVSRIEQKVYREGGMPRAWATYKNFWLSSGPEQHKLLAGFMPNDNTGAVGPGRPFAQIVGPTKLKLADQANYSADQTLFATAFVWKVISAPDGSAFLNSAGNEKSFGFLPDLPGEYIIELVVMNSVGHESTAETKNLTVGAADISFIDDIYAPILSSLTTDVGGVCSECHSAGLGAPEWWQNTASATWNYLINNQSMSGGKYIDTENVDASVLLTKAAGGTEELSHPGGEYPGFDIDGNVDNNQTNYQTIKNWILSGALNN